MVHLSTDLFCLLKLSLIMPLTVIRCCSSFWEDSTSDCSSTGQTGVYFAFVLGSFWMSWVICTGPGSSPPPPALPFCVFQVGFFFFKKITGLVVVKREACEKECLSQCSLSAGNHFGTGRKGIEIAKEDLLQGN